MNKILIDDYNKLLSQKIPWQKLKNKTVLISGANGFISSYIIEFLLFLNESRNIHIHVVGICRSKKKAEKRFWQYRKRAELDLLVQDVSHPTLYKKKINFIIHAASLASPKYYDSDPVGVLKPNILGTYHFLEYARTHPIESILFISAGETYGIMPASGKTDEQTYGSLNPATVRSAYAESKRMTETMAVSWHHQYKVPVKIVRLYHTYGPGIKLDDGRVFADFISNIVQNQNIVMKSRGEAVRSFIYIADAVAGFFMALLKGESGEAYNVANEQATLSIKELAYTLTQLFPEKKLRVIFQKRKKNDRYVESPIKFNYPSTAKLRKLGWKPHYSLQEGFKRTIESFTA